MKTSTKILSVLLALCLVFSLAACAGKANNTDPKPAVTDSAAGEAADKAAADEVAALIDAIYVQERNDKTDEQCAAAKAAWDALTDAQKALAGGADEAVKAFLAQTLVQNENPTCDHHGHEHGEDHSCGSHGEDRSCGSHGCGKR